MEGSTVNSELVSNLEAGFSLLGTCYSVSLLKCSFVMEEGQKKLAYNLLCNLMPGPDILTGEFCIEHVSVSQL